MFKKFFSAIIAITLILTVAPASVFAAGETIVTVTTPKTLPKAGQTFTITVDISNNPGIDAAQFALTYDKTKMQCIEASTGSVLDGMLSATNPNNAKGAVIAAASANETNKDGKIAEFTFKANKDLSSFDFELNDVILSGSNGNNINYKVSGASESSEAPTDTKPADTPEKEKKNPLESLIDFIKDEAEELKEKEAKKAEEVKKEEQKKTETQTIAKQETVKQEETKTEPSAPEKTAEEIKKEEAKKDADKKAQELIAKQEELLDLSKYTFSDTTGHWAESYIAKSVQMGIFSGVGNGKFNPDANITRGQFITVLYRMSGSPYTEVSVPFVDIKDELPEFQKAISWGYNKGLVNGKSKNKFAPQDNLTRQEAMKILFAYDGGVSGEEVMFTSIYDAGFTDSNQIASWAKPAMYWAYYNKIISGTGASTLGPEALATRAQMAKILVSYIEMK